MASDSPAIHMAAKPNPMTRLSTPSPRARLASELFAFLDERAVPYVVVGDVRGYRLEVPGDIDFVVADAAFPAMHSVLAAFASQHGARFVQAIRHERAAYYFVLAQDIDRRPVFLHPDVCAAYVRRGRGLMDAEELLEGRVRSPEGCVVPAPSRAFGYYLLKRVDKGVLDSRAFAYLRSQWSADSTGCASWLAGRLPAAMVGALAGALERDDHDAVVPMLTALRRAIARTSPIRLNDRWAEFCRAWDRWARPTGTWITVFGPDGAGKSSVIDSLEERLVPAFRRTRRYHLRPHLGRHRSVGGPPVTDPHSREARSWLASLAKAAYWWWDATAGYWLLVRWQLVRSTLVLFDRYVDDLAIDPRRYRYGGPAWVVEVLRRMTPRPDLTIVLDAPADVLQSRKAEVKLEESERQRSAYLALADRSRHAVVVDASAPLESVVRDVEAAILDQLEARTSRRLGLG